MRSSLGMATRGVVLSVGIVITIVLVFLLYSRQGELSKMEPESAFELPPLTGLELSLIEPLPQPPSLKIAADEGLELQRLTPTPFPLPSAEDRLSSIMSEWVYRGQFTFGDKQMGRFTHSKRKEEMRVSLGEEIEQGAIIEELNRLVAVARLEDATMSLALVPEYKVSEADYANPQLPNEYQTQKRMTAYWEQYGKRFKEAAKKYTPKPGEMMPPSKPPSPEEAATKKAEYMERFAPRFRQMDAKRTPFPGEIMPAANQDPLEEQQAIEAYFEKFRPGGTPPPRREP